MIPPIRFFWSKILPISYDNYLSETEILEYMRSKFNEIITTLNHISEFIKNDLDDRIEDIAGDVADKKILEALEPIISDITALTQKIDSLQKMLQEQIDAIKKEQEELASDIDHLNTKFLGLIADLDAKIQRELTVLQNQLNALDKRIDLNLSIMELKLSTAEKNWLKLLNRQYRILTKYIRDWFNKLAETSIMVTNPWTGGKVTLQEMINILFNKTTHGLTALEYRQLNLTALQYRMLYLTAREYRLYGIDKDDGNPEPVKMYDLYGRKVEQPLSSVWSVFGHGVNAKVNDWEITCEQWNRLGLSTYTLDKWGLYYLSNHGSSVYKDTVHLTADTIVITPDSARTQLIEVSGILKVDEDNGIVTTQELLTDESIKKLIKNVDVELVGDSADYPDPYGNWSIVNWTYSLVAGGIAFNAKLNANCSYRSTDVDEDGDRITKPPTYVIDVTAITTTGYYD